MRITMEWLKNIARSILNEELEEYDLRMAKMEEELHTQRIDAIDPFKELTEFYNNKYPKMERRYRRQMLGKELNIPVECFAGHYRNSKLPILSHPNEDARVIEALAWVITRFKYITEEENYGLKEYWTFSFESIEKMSGDCEDGAILLYDILRKSGIPTWQLRINVGYAIHPKTGVSVGHAYLTYYSIAHNKWVALDWCYFPDVTKIIERPSYNDNLIYGDVFFSFNEEFCWSKSK